ncbi:hypothetical protein N646_3748 [Vibrio alginolyticus NBRC 15630 = ATCC 17749]|uniref:Uncharacterized protein n=1 Tax=Vibrio alginolyticus (strain ATCC 17749 / DSM 2171 / NBRC 15630 / NCIMB 1903 / NCTC 12160 / XII-53) TaxID=1219076 RepID=A0A2I3CNM7_VIBAX|nr:hypothetical protein N646_3748 [Vibrio alginolyticus NBRC 15630 = ATCC 17749]
MFYLKDVYLRNEKEKFDDIRLSLKSNTFDKEPVERPLLGLGALLFLPN